MPATTKQTPTTDKLRSMPASLRNAHRAMRRDALARWRDWARAAADGGTMPEPHELLAVGAMLRIQQPADALEADAEIVREFADAERGAATCERALAEKLAEWGGDRRKLAAAVQAAEAKAKELRAQLEHIDNGGGLGHWHMTRGQIRLRSRRLWPEFEDVVLANLEGDE